MLVHHLSGRFIFEGLVGHHMAPMARGIADGKQDWLVFSLCFFERLIVPGEPIDRVFCMLQEVGTCLVRKVISHVQNSRIYGCPKLVCTLFENPLIIPLAASGCE